jgi:MFS family permease
MLKTFRAARAQGLIVAAFVAMFLGGIADSAVNLLAPLQLDASELSTGSIGIVFSASAAVFIVTSAWVARIGDRAVTLGVVGVSALVLAGSFVPAIVGTDAAPVIASVLARSPFLAVLYTVGLPLGAEAARRAGLGRGAVIGLINVGWGSATAVGPVAAGGLAEAAGERVVYAVVLGACLAVGAWMLASARSASRRPVEAEQS